MQVVLIFVVLQIFLFFPVDQFKWRLVKKAAQVFYLHFALKKRAFIEEIHEKQEQVCIYIHAHLDYF